MSLPVPSRVSEADALLAIPTSPFSEKSLGSLRRALGTTNGRPTLMGGHSIAPRGHARIVEALSNFQRQLTAGPADRPLIAVELAKLLGTFPTQDASVSAALRVDAYRDALGNAPAWAVREARLRIIRGEAVGLDQRFAPTPPQLVTLIAEILQPFRKDLADLQALADVPPTEGAGSETHTRVAEGFDRLRESLAPATTAPKDARRRDIDALHRRLRNNGMDEGALDAIPDAPLPRTFEKGRAP